jgi:hypothetical protein
MLGKYFKQRDNPWELLAIASWLFAPGLALLLYSGPALILKRSRNVRASAEPFWGGFRVLNRTVTPAEVHTFGWCAVTIAAFLLALYIYVRWTKTHGPSTPTLLVTIATCYDINEAFRLQMVLGTADIPSFQTKRRHRTHPTFSLEAGRESGSRWRRNTRQKPSELSAILARFTSFTTMTGASNMMRRSNVSRSNQTMQRTPTRRSPHTFMTKLFHLRSTLASGRRR